MSAIDDLIAGLDSDDAADALNTFIESGEGTKEERDSAKKLRNAIRDQQLADAVARFEARTIEFTVLVDRLDSISERMKTSHMAGANVVAKIAGAAGKALGSVFARDQMAPALDNQQETDEAIAAPGGSISEPPANVPEPEAADPSVPVIRSQPVTLSSKDYKDLRDEYVRFFFGSFILDDNLPAVERAAKRILDNKARYEAVGNPLNIPWWFIGCIHAMESGGNFHTHLHNGDPLSARTVRVPKGHPAAAPASGNAYTWEESAADALKLKHLHEETSWTLSRVLYRLERYNGFGYRKRGVPSPYLWSFCSVYAKGKYVADGQYDGNAVSKQCGAAVIMKYLYKSGDIKLYEDENEQVLDPDFGKQAQDAHTNPIPAPPVVSPLPAFDQFFNDHFPGQMHFFPAEFLVKGNQHASGPCQGKNTDPPEALWPNVVPLVKVLQEFRARIGAPVKLLSVYRSPAYNSCIGGAAESHHMKFHAADFVVLKQGTGPIDWARVLDQMRGSENIFKGGLHAYRTFVHVDTRGVNKNW